MILTGLLYGAALAIIVFLIGWLWHFFKALKDPDVTIASDLRMTITRYRHYRELYEELQELMKTYGSDSPYVDEIFRIKIFPKIKNPNEWRRYQAYRWRELQNSIKIKFHERTGKPLPYDEKESDADWCFNKFK